MKITPLRLVIIMFVFALIFSTVFVTVQRIDTYFNPPPTPVTKVEKVE